VTFFVLQAVVLAQAAHMAAAVVVQVDFFTLLLSL
jgi:hypothetical protein